MNGQGEEVKTEMAKYTIEGDTVAQLLDGFRQVIAQEAASGAMKALENALGPDDRPVMRSAIVESSAGPGSQSEPAEAEDDGGDIEPRGEMPTMVHRARAQREFGLTWSQIRKAEREGTLTHRKRGHLVMYPVTQLQELADRLGNVARAA